MGVPLKTAKRRVFGMEHENNRVAKAGGEASGELRGSTSFGDAPEDLRRLTRCPKHNTAMWLLRF
ncbi:MAG: hypothetical protein JW836_07970 [Deltaproteobacteria bacterium]|nr:hypothetical protein [Deltaproteobacteria bacterium]